MAGKGRSPAGTAYKAHNCQNSRVMCGGKDCWIFRFPAGDLQGLVGREKECDKAGRHAWGKRACMGKIDAHIFLKRHGRNLQRSEKCSGQAEGGKGMGPEDGPGQVCVRACVCVCMFVGGWARVSVSVCVAGGGVVARGCECQGTTQTA